MDDTKKFEDFFDKMQGLLDNAKKRGHIIVRVEDLENAFPELKQNKDERIREELIDAIQGLWVNDALPMPLSLKRKDDWIDWLEKQTNTKVKDFSENREDLSDFYKQVCHMAASLLNKEYDYTMETIEWYAYTLLKYAKKELEKQGEQSQGKSAVEAAKEEKVDNANKVEPKFKVGDWYQCTKDFFGKGVTFDKNTAYYCAKEGCLQNEYGCHIAIVKDLYDNFKLWTIQDAKDGDVLAASDGSIFLFAGVVDWACKHYVALTTDNIVKFNEGLEHYWETSGAVRPANKEQRDLLMKAMAEAGYTFDFEKKELKKIDTYCQENCKGFQETGKCFADGECKAKRDAESTDKVEPKFKVGDWCIDNEDGTIFQIVKVLDNTYTYKTNEGKEYSCTHYSLENDARLWTIQDAKNGDVLAIEDKNFVTPFVAIYKSLNDTIYNGLRDNTTFNSRCFIGFNGNFYIGEEGHVIEDIHPATKEQRDILFQKMKEAGYEWNAEKKELKKVEENSSDKVEPKFKKGEWLCENEPNNYARFIQILETVNVQGKERYRISRDIHNDEDIVEFDFVEKYYHKFDIQDAKDGDVLNSMRVHATIIFKGFAEDGKHILAYCALQKGIFIKQEMLWDRDFEPASEYWKNALYDTMVKAGYEWDEDKKELKKIEDEPENYKQHLMNEMADLVKDYIRKKPTWSEEDEKNLNSILSCIKHCQVEDTEALYNGNLYVDPKRYESMSDWLKSLKERML